MERRNAVRTKIAGLLLCLVASSLEGRGPSTPEERQTAVQLTRLVEREPLTERARDARAWLLNWLEQVPDISVTICDKLLGTNFELTHPYFAELVVQQAFSAAAFIVEHPEHASDHAAVDLAALEGTLLVYESILSTQPKARSASLDRLLEARSEGQLRAQVLELSKSCH